VNVVHDKYWQFVVKTTWSFNQHQDFSGHTCRHKASFRKNINCHVCIVDLFFTLGKSIAIIAILDKTTARVKKKGDG